MYNASYNDTKKEEETIKYSNPNSKEINKSAGARELRAPTIESLLSGGVIVEEE